MKVCYCCKRRGMEVCNCDRVHRRSCLLCHKHCRCTVSPLTPACARPKPPGK